MSLGSEKSGGVSLTINICLSIHPTLSSPRLIPERGGGVDFRGMTLQRVVADRSSWSSTRSCLSYENSRKNGERFEENLRESRKRRLDDSRGTPVVVGRCSLCSPHAPAQWVGRMRDENNGGRVLNLWTDSIRPAPPSSLPSTFSVFFVAPHFYLHIYLAAHPSLVSPLDGVSVSVFLYPRIYLPLLLRCLIVPLFSPNSSRAWKQNLGSILRVRLRRKLRRRDNGKVYSSRWLYYERSFIFSELEVAGNRFLLSNESLRSLDG